MSDTQNLTVPSSLASARANIRGNRIDSAINDLTLYYTDQKFNSSVLRSIDIVASNLSRADTKWRRGTISNSQHERIISRNTELLLLCTDEKQSLNLPIIFAINKAQSLIVPLIFLFIALILFPVLFPSNELKYSKSIVYNQNELALNLYKIDNVSNQYEFSIFSIDTNTIWLDKIKVVNAITGSEITNYLVAPDPKTYRQQSKISFELNEMGKYKIIQKIERLDQTFISPSNFDCEIQPGEKLNIWVHFPYLFHVKAIFYIMTIILIMISLLLYIRSRQIKPVIA